MSTGGAVSVNLRERRWEVDSRVGRGFNELDVLPRSTANDGVQRKFEYHSVYFTVELE